MRHSGAEMPEVTNEITRCGSIVYDNARGFMVPFLRACMATAFLGF